MNKKTNEHNRALRIEAALRHPDLGDRERVVLAAYVHFEEEHGARFGHPGLCWPSDGEVSAYLGRGEQSVRRARRALTAPRAGGALLSVRYVPPFGKLPSGQESAHGANVFTLRGYASPAAAPHALAVADAQEEVARRAHALALAKARAQVLSEQPVANDEGGTSHNAPSRITPAWSHLNGHPLERGGRRGSSRAA